MAMNGYCTLPRSPEVKSPHQIHFGGEALNQRDTISVFLFPPTWYQKSTLIGVANHGKLSGISALNRRTILNKINVSFIVHFCLGKYNFSLDPFLTHFVCCKNEHSTQKLHSRTKNITWFTLYSIKNNGLFPQSYSLLKITLINDLILYNYSYVLNKAK